MKHLQTPFFLGKLKLQNNIFYSPLAGWSDFPYRKMAAQYQPGLIYCEMVKMDALVRHDTTTFHILDFSKEMHPIGAQIVGSKPSIAGQAAKIIEDLGFDIIDLNCGCPVDKVTKDGGGSGLLKQPELIAEIISNMVAAVDIPVTVKIRSGWDDDSLNAMQITKLAEEAGAQAIAIHGRTRAQGYKGKANWDHIKACKEVAKEIKVIGNGDVFDALAAEQMFEQTKCDAVLVSRGTMGNPWIAEDIYRHLSGQTAVQRNKEWVKNELLKHLDYCLEYSSEAKAVIDMRRFGCWYFKKGNQTKEFRKAITRVESTQDASDVINHFFCSE